MKEQLHFAAYQKISAQKIINILSLCFTINFLFFPVDGGLHLAQCV